MKKSLIAIAALSAMGSSAGWARRSADEPHGHELRAIACGGLFAKDDDEFAGLSEQERAALAEPTGGEDEQTLRAIAGKELPAGAAGADAGAGDGEGEGKEEDGDGDGKAKPDAAAAQVTADAAAAAAATAAAATNDGKAADGKDPAGIRTEEPVSYTIAAPEDAEAQITALNADKAKAFKQLMDGEITPEAYSQTESEVAGKISAIERQLTKAETAAEITTQNAQRSYLGKVNALLDTAKAEGVDYRTDKALHEQLDRTVKWLAHDPSNADKSEQWFLDEAHAMVKARNGLGKAGTPPPPPPGDKKTTGKAPDLSGLPPTLRNTPPAAGSDDGGEFAHLDGLKGMDLERAVAKLNPEQQQRWAEA